MFDFKYLMTAKKPLRIISVTGAHSSVGKTTLCSILLKGLKGFGAIKFTKTPEHRTQNPDNPPLSPLKLRGDERGAIKIQNSLLIEDIGTLKQKGKDTAVMLESGAERVAWIKSPYNKLKPLLETALGRMTGLKGVIVEGNSPVDFINPYLIIFIVDPVGEIKPTAIKVSKKADIIIINSRKRVKRLPSLPMIGIDGREVFWIDLVNKRGEVNEFLNFVKERINKNTN